MDSNKKGSQDGFCPLESLVGDLEGRSYCPMALGHVLGGKVAGVRLQPLASEVTTGLCDAEAASGVPPCSLSVL